MKLRKKADGYTRNIKRKRIDSRAGNTNATRQKQHGKLLKGIDGAKIFASFTKMIIQIEKASDATEIIKLYNTFKTEHPISIYAVDQFKYVFKNNMD